MHQHIRGFDEPPTMATFLGPRCAIATRPFAIISKKLKAILRH